LPAGTEEYSAQINGLAPIIVIPAKEVSANPADSQIRRPRESGDPGASEIHLASRDPRSIPGIMPLPAVGSGDNGVLTQKRQNTATSFARQTQGCLCRRVRISTHHPSSSLIAALTAIATWNVFGIN